MKSVVDQDAIGRANGIEMSHYGKRYFAIHGFDEDFLGPFPQGSMGLARPIPMSRAGRSSKDRYKGRLCVNLQPCVSDRPAL